MQLDMQKSLQIVTRLFCNFSGHKENYEKEGVIYRFDTAKLAEVEKSDVLYFYLRKFWLCSDFTQILAKYYEIKLKDFLLKIRVVFGLEHCSASSNDIDLFMINQRKLS